MTKEERQKNLMKVALFRKWFFYTERIFDEKDELYRAHLRLIISVFTQALAQCICGYEDRRHQLYKVTPKITNEEFMDFIEDNRFYHYFNLITKKQVVNKCKEILDKLGN